MTTSEIQDYVDKAIRENFEGYTSDSGEMMTSEEGDGRFLGKVFATRYMGLSSPPDIFLVVGETKKKVQIIKFGNSECIQPSESDLDLLLRKELGLQ